MQRYLQGLSSRLSGLLGNELLAVTLTGSAAFGDWNAGSSDIDVIAICRSPIETRLKQQIVSSVSHPVLPCPARGLELVLYRRDAVSAPSLGVEYELNLNSGPAIEERVDFDRRDESGHWFVVDLAIARGHGVALLGPGLESLVGRIEEPQLRAALSESLRWHVGHEPSSPNSVLNACRAWRYVSEDVWSSKTDAARWAIERASDPALVTAALAARSGSAATLDERRCRLFVEHVGAILEGP
jgi:hypothetical protein